MRNTILMVLAGALLVTGFSMMSAAPVMSTEAGADAVYEASISSTKCKMRYHQETGTAEQHGNGLGSGGDPGAFVGVHTCSDLWDAKNICDSYIEGQYECQLVGNIRSSCESPCFE